MIRPLMVLPVVAAVMAPVILIVVIPDRAPVAETSRPDDCRLNVPVALPIEVFAVPVVLIEVVPVIVAPPLNVLRPDTPRVLLRVVAPETPSVLLNVVAPVTPRVPDTEVFPFSRTAPVPVSKVPLPLIAKLPLAWV